LTLEKKNRRKGTTCIIHDEHHYLEKLAVLSLKVSHLFTDGVLSLLGRQMTKIVADGGLGMEKMRRHPEHKARPARPGRRACRHTFFLPFCGLSS
jgi:hypothetical protein